MRPQVKFSHTHIYIYIEMYIYIYIYICFMFFSGIFFHLQYIFRSSKIPYSAGPHWVKGPQRASAHWMWPSKPTATAHTAWSWPCALVELVSWNFLFHFLFGLVLNHFFFHFCSTYLSSLKLLNQSFFGVGELDFFSVSRLGQGLQSVHVWPQTCWFHQKWTNFQRKHKPVGEIIDQDGWVGRFTTWNRFSKIPTRLAALSARFSSNMLMAGFQSRIHISDHICILNNIIIQYNAFMYTYFHVCIQCSYINIIYTYIYL